MNRPATHLGHGASRAAFATVGSAAQRPVWGEGIRLGVRHGSLSGRHRADIVIVGGGLSGLWTAFHLLHRDPDRSVMIVEARHCGFGASGRNGGWCSSLFPLEGDALAARVGVGGAAAMDAAMRASVEATLQTCDDNGIDAAAHKGGIVMLARNAAERDRLHDSVHPPRIWLGPAEASQRVRTHRPPFGALFDPDGAALDPARLVDGLRRRVVEMGATIAEQTAVELIEPARVTTADATIDAGWIVRCTEAYTAGLSGHHRDIVPLTSLIVATEPLDDSTWKRIGFANRETVSDGRRALIYAHRTRDGRMVYGGRGAPYRYGSRTSDRPGAWLGVHRRLVEAMVEMFPELADARITHRWGGVLGAPRDWMPGVVVDRSSQLAHAGGYVGDGVSTTYLAGLTVAALIDDTGEPCTRLPWVGHRSPRWEPEPLRKAGISAAERLARLADHLDERDVVAGRAVGGIVDRLTGG